MLKSVRYCGFLLVVLIASEAGAHICDNVWRQAQKLIIKPEVTSLVVKDKASFKIYVQSNMDQNISGELRLVGRSEAFDIQVEPLKGHNVQTGKQYEYDVTLTLKQGVGSGEYPLHFDAVVGNRTMKSYAMEAVRGQSGPARTARKVQMVSISSPEIDGSAKDFCWKSATMLRPESNTDAGVPIHKSAALITGDQTNIYVCTSAAVAGQGGDGQSKDSVILLLSAPGSDDMYKFKITADGNITASITRKNRETSLDTKKLGVTSATKMSAGVWGAELCVPIVAIGGAGRLENQVWRLNIICECVHDRGETNFWAGTPQNYSTLEGLSEVVFSR